MYEYKTISMPTYLGYKGRQTISDALATYIQETINNNCTDGWEYYSTDTYYIEEVPGCWGMLLGCKSKSGTYNVLVFRRNKTDV